MVDAKAQENRLTITGRLVERAALRFTPAGVAIVNFTIGHESRQIEAGGAREVKLELHCLAVEQEARLIAAAPLGAELRVTGFLAPKGRSSRQTILHTQSFEFVQGEIRNGNSD